MDRSTSSRRHDSSDVWGLEPDLASTSARRARPSDDRRAPRPSDERRAEQPSPAVVLLELQEDLHRLEGKVDTLDDSTAQCRDANEQLAELRLPCERVERTTATLRGAMISRFELAETKLAALKRKNSAMLECSERVKKLIAAEVEADARAAERAKARARDAAAERAAAHRASRDAPRDAYGTGSALNSNAMINGYHGYGTPESEAHAASRAAYAARARLRETSPPRRSTPESSRGGLQHSENIDPHRSSRDAATHSSSRRRSISPTQNGPHSGHSRFSPYAVNGYKAAPLTSSDPVRRAESTSRSLEPRINGTYASTSKRVEASPRRSGEKEVNGPYASPPKRTPQPQPRNDHTSSSFSSDTHSFPPLQEPLPPYWEKRLSKASFFYTLVDILLDLAKRGRREISAETVHAELRKYMGSSEYYDMLDACWGTQRFLGVAAKFIKISKLRSSANGLVLEDASRPFRDERDNHAYFSRVIDLTSDDAL